MPTLFSWVRMKMGLGLTGKLGREWVGAWLVMVWWCVGGVINTMLYYLDWGWEWEDPRPGHWEDPGLVRRGNLWTTNNTVQLTSSPWVKMKFWNLTEMFVPSWRGQSHNSNALLQSFVGIAQESQINFKSFFKINLSKNIYYAEFPGPIARLRLA